MTDEQKIFYSKILLFGEYALMFGSYALSIPYRKYSGRFVFGTQQSSSNITYDSNINLLGLLEYLKKQKVVSKLIWPIYFDKFEDDIKSKAVRFESNIPLGYGLGSSGALVAAVYNYYAVDKIFPYTKRDNKTLNLLRRQFSVMESYFHGKSSGFDPLTCYLETPVLIEKNNKLRQIILPDFNEKGMGALFLIDSRQKGETQPLVNYFVEKYKSKEFSDKVNSNLIPLNNFCIDMFIKSRMPDLMRKIGQLSLFTYQEMVPMIPNNLREVWKNGLNTGDYFLKLCGSGGGGMMLGFTGNFDALGKVFQDFDIQMVMRF